MENINKRVMYECLVLHEKGNSELKLATENDTEYSRWHLNNKDWYWDFSSKMRQILNLKSSTIDEVAEEISKMEFTPEQKRALIELRKEPMFKRAKGEVALESKSELERVLGTKLTVKGKTFADESGAYESLKTEKQIESEFDVYDTQLANLLTSRAITQEQFDTYSRKLDDIHAYYVSQSKGEQIPFRKMSDSQYAEVEERAYFNGISFSEQLCSETMDIRDNFDDIQQLASETTHKAR